MHVKFGCCGLSTVSQSSTVLVAVEAPFSVATVQFGQNGVDGELFKFQFSAVMFHGHYDVPELVVNHLQVVLLQMVFKCFFLPRAVVNQEHFQGPAKQSSQFVLITLSTTDRTYLLLFIQPTNAFMRL